MANPRLLAPLAALILSLLFTLEASAYRPHSRVWPSGNTTYKFTSNFSGFGAGWTTTAHDAANEWNTETDFTFSHNNNSQNTIDHGQLAAPYEDALAVTYWYWNNTAYRTRFNMVISEDKHPYYDGTQGPTAPDLYYDLQSIMTHEFGHAAGLDHVNTTTQVMYCCFGNRTSNPNTHVRDQVLQDERNGMRWLYENNYNLTHPAGMGPWDPASNGHYDDAHKFVGYKGTTWSANTNLTNPRYPQDNTLTWANSVGATTWFQANTNRITWQYTKHYLRGFAEVYVDGNYQGTYNLDDDDDTIWRVRRTWEFPTVGDHVIEVRNATVSDYIDADAFIAGIGYFSQGTYENSTPGLGYFGTWTHSTCCGWASGGNLSWSNIADNGVTFTFKGSAITYRFTKAYNRGKVKITTDGEFQEIIDLYADTPNGPNNCRCFPMQTKTYHFPNNGVHTINITVTGDKNILAADRYVDIDTLIVLP